MFFIEDRSKVEIANELGLSRFRVARLLNAARDVGIVTITINEPVTRTGLADELALRYSLLDVAVVPSADTLGAIGRAGAQMLRRHLREGDVLGVAWGRAVDAVVGALPEVKMAPAAVDVVQLAGSMVDANPAYDATGIAARAAAALGGTLTPLHAPAFLESSATRRALLAEPSIAAAVEAFRRVTVSLFGIGAIGPDSESALVAADSLPSKARRELARAGATADVACHFFDASGRLVKTWESRTIAVSLDVLKASALRIGVAAGAAKGPAVRAALCSGTVNALVIDTACALAITDLS
jgi:DNA-binding transcriptional regulator LsrR (DeoR family)